MKLHENVTKLVILQKVMPNVTATKKEKITTQTSRDPFIQWHCIGYCSRSPRIKLLMMYEQPLHFCINKRNNA